MIKTTSALRGASLADNGQWQPSFYRLSRPDDRKRVADVLADPRVLVHDTLSSQVKELVRSLNPSVKFSAETLENAAQQHLASTPLEEYGVWVHYPWSNRLVHLLDEFEFALVRTDRNRNKITREEQAILASKRIGVIGLSVGQSIALTMAMERSFGEIRLADFDTLDLSNLNRIRSGVHQLGVKKVVNVAREIMEIDPFLKVTLYEDGITRDNIDRFCTEGGKLDILVDECDSVDVKIYCRQTAKDLGIPVVMDTSDRGMIDVERFDLETDRPILHGLIEHLDPNDAAEARTNEEKLPFLAPIAGLDSLSPRMKASMMDLGKTIVTWPQLGSAVAFGGAITAEVCRWILLGLGVRSGRWYVDPEEIFSLDEIHRASKPDTVTPSPLPLSIETMVALAGMVPLSATELDDAAALALVEAGAMAPSAGNSQPWKFLVGDGRVLLFHDVSRSFSRLDTIGLIGDIGMGACMENVLVKADGMGLSLSYSILPIKEERSLVAVFELARGSGIKPSAHRSLVEQISVRHTNRKPGPREPLAMPEKEALQNQLVGLAGVDLHFVEAPHQLKAIGRLCGKAEMLRLINKHGHKEFFEDEIRWTPAKASSTRTGLDVRTLELSPLDYTGLRLASDTRAMALIRRWNAGQGLEKLAYENILASGAVAVIHATDLSIRSRLLTGRAAQRLWLQASALGLSVHPMSAPLFLSHEFSAGSSVAFDTEQRRVLADISDGVSDLFGNNSGYPLFLCRVTRASETEHRSLRLPLENVLYRNVQTHAPIWNS